MEFRDWLFSEEVKVVANILKTHQVIRFGKIALWDVYSAVPNPNPKKENRVISVEQYLTAPRW